MMNTFLGNEVVIEKANFSKQHVFVDSNNICRMKDKVKVGFLARLSQNSDLHRTYDHLIQISNAQIDKELEKLKYSSFPSKSLENISNFFQEVYKKINKSKKPSFPALLLIKVNNFFSKFLGIKKIEIYNYDKKNRLLDIKKRIENFVKKSIKPKPASITSSSSSSLSSSSDNPSFGFSSIGSDSPSFSLSSSTSSSSMKKNKKIKLLPSLPSLLSLNLISSSSSASSFSSPSSSNLSSIPLSEKVFSPKSSKNPKVASLEIIGKKDLEKLQAEGKWDELLDELKLSYRDDIGEEVLRLKDNGVLNEDVIKPFFDAVYKLEKSKTDVMASKYNQESVKIAIGRALEIKSYFKNNFWILVTAQDARWQVVNYLNKELIRHKLKSKQSHNFKYLRIPKAKTPIVKYRTKFTHDHEPETQRALISCDIEFDKNINPWESSLHFLSHGSSVYSTFINASEKNIKQAIKENPEIPYEDKQELLDKLFNKLMAVVKHYVKEIEKDASVGALHVMCLPKDRATKGEFSYLYRAHPFGKMCNCATLVGLGEEKVLEQLQNNSAVTKCDGDKNTQYRILADNLDPQFDKIVTISTISQALRHKIKNDLRNVLDDVGFKGKRPTKPIPSLIPHIPVLDPSDVKVSFQQMKPLLAIHFDDLNVSDYFLKVDKMNHQSKVTDLRANILLGPKTLGYFDKVPMPFCAEELKPEDIDQIKIESEIPYELDINNETQPIFGRDIKVFNYDSNGNVRELCRKKTMPGRYVCIKTSKGVEKVEKGLEPTFTAKLSRKSEVNLNAAQRKAFKIHPNAKYFYFVNPIEALGQGLVYETKRELEDAGLKPTPEQIQAKIAHYTQSIIETLTARFGADFAALMYIGGYAYFDQDDKCIQVKALVGNPTEDVLSIKGAKKSMEFVPEGLRGEFNESVRRITSPPNFPKDGICSLVTSPELLEYGARQFAWIGPGYIPEADKKKIANGDKKLQAEYELLYSEKVAQAGFFMYKFNDTEKKPLVDSKLDCFLAIGVDNAEDMPEGTLGNVTILKNGKLQKIQALVEDKCIIGHCRDALGNSAPSNVVWLTKNADTGVEKYRKVCCSECNKGLSTQNRDRLYRQKVIAQYEVSVTIDAINDQFYDSLHLNQIKDFQDADIAEMASSQSFPVLGMSGAPPNAVTAQFLYPAEKLAMTTPNPQLKNLYIVGGYAYHNVAGVCVGIDELLLQKTVHSRELKFEALKEVKLSEELKEKFKVSLKVDMKLKKEQIPLITLKSLRARGVRNFMWIPPNDKAFPSAKGMYLYFSADGETAFAKVVT